VTPTYSAFGDLVVHTPDGDRVASRRRERDTLAVLLAHRAPVAPDRLLAEVWESGTGLGSLQAVVSRLRSLLEPRREARGESRCLVSSSAGYALRAATADVDTWQFEDLARRCLAEPDPATALDLHDQGEVLWTGPPYGDCECESVVAARARLVELRAGATERAGEALLALGDPGRAALLLGPLVREHPFRERSAATLALGLYRSGRQSEALATLRELRGRLSAELGVDPTPEVRRLEEEILRQDPRLDTPPSGPDRPPGPHRPVAPSRVAPPPPLQVAEPIGRADSLALTSSLLDEVRAGRFAVATVLGEPGVGKTTLVEEVCRRAEAQGLGTVLGRCHEGDVAPALWPWMQVVRRLAPDPGDDDPLLAPLAAAGDAPVDTESGSLRLFDAVGALLGRAASAHDGLVVVLEDIHWADATSLQLLTHLVERPPAAPLLVIVTRRTTEQHLAERLVGALAALARAGATRIRLDGLGRADVGRLLEQVLGPVPEGVRDVVAQRVARLPEGGRRLLSSAAVLGRVIEPADAAALAGESLDEALDHLDLALAVGLLEEDGDRYVFAHALTRETLYAATSAARRIRLHARAAEVLAARVGDLPDAAADIAYHARLAAPLGPDHARAAYDRLARAAQVALARQAPLEARELWMQARAVAESLGLDDERLRAMLGVARSAVRMGTFTEAPTLVTELATEASRRGRWDLVVEAAATFQLAGAWTWRTHGRKDEDLIAVFTEALPHVSGRDEAALCGTLLVEHQFGWDTAASDAYAVRAVRVARECGDRDLLCSVLLSRLIASAGRADLGPRARLAEELLAEHPRDEIEVAALIHLGFALHEEGRVDEADAAMDRARARAASLSHSGLEVPLAWWRYSVARDHDDPAAEALGREALAAHLGQRFYYGTELQTLHAVLSRPEGARVDDATIADARTGLHAQRALVAWALTTTGDLDLAADVVGPMPPAHAVDYSIEASLCLRLLVAAALGRTGDVTELLHRVDAYTTPLAVYGSVAHLGSYDYFRAVARRALGDPARALDLARHAVTVNRTCDIRPWLRRSEALVAELEAQVGATAG
jgi:DNA-binding SARP family transcriptional activator